MRPLRAREAFSLVELSIVIVILGLLVGGILSGQSLIRAAGIRGLMTDAEKYRSAILKFQDEFRATPGDMTNATEYWGAADGTTGITAACYNNQKSGLATCNGNGNNVMDIYNAVTGFYDGTEAYLAWQHLANAGMISGSYSGTALSPGANHLYGTTGGKNVPAGRLSNSVYILWGIGGDPNDATWFAGWMTNILAFNTSCASGCYLNTSSYILTPRELYNIDSKNDDGLPGFGNTRTFRSLTNCISSANEYALTSTTKTCFGFMGIEPIR